MHRGKEWESDLEIGPGLAHSESVSRGTSYRYHHRVISAASGPGPETGALNGGRSLKNATNEDASARSPFSVLYSALYIHDITDIRTVDSERPWCVL
jgi:hypothetical protein